MDKYGWRGWVESTTPQISSAQESINIADYLDMNSKITYLNKQTENGVSCKHYSVDMNMTVKNPNPQEGAPAEISAHFTGEIWVADQSGLPKVMIREIGTSEMEMPAHLGKITMNEEVNYTNINDDSISISPPPEDEIIHLPVNGGSIRGGFPTDIPTDTQSMPCSEFKPPSQESVMVCSRPF